MTEKDLPAVWELKRTDPMYYRARRQSHRERGLCLNCTRRPVPGLKRCRVCYNGIREIQQREKHRARQKAIVKQRREERKEQGLCYICGKPLTIFDAAKRVSCNACAEKRRRAAREGGNRRYYDAVARGVCIRCRQAPALPNLRRCQPCREAHNAKARKG